MAGPGFAAVGLGECFIDYKSAILVQDTQSVFHPLTQRNAFLRGRVNDPDSSSVGVDS